MLYFETGGKGFTCFNKKSKIQKYLISRCCHILSAHFNFFTNCSRIGFLLIVLGRNRIASLGRDFENVSIFDKRYQRILNAILNFPVTVIPVELPANKGTWRR